MGEHVSSREQDEGPECLPAEGQDEVNTGGRKGDHDEQGRHNSSPFNIQIKLQLSRVGLVSGDKRSETLDGTYSKNENLNSDFLVGSFAQHGHTGLEEAVGSRVI